MKFAAAAKWTVGFVKDFSCLSRLLQDISRFLLLNTWRFLLILGFLLQHQQSTNLEISVAKYLWFFVATWWQENIWGFVLVHRISSAFCCKIFQISAAKYLKISVANILGFLLQQENIWRFLLVHRMHPNCWLRLVPEPPESTAGEYLKLFKPLFIFDWKH